MTRLLDWTDDDGRTWRSQLPDDAPPDADPRYYTPIGPVDTSSLNLPDHIAVRLHNELHSRCLFSWRELRHHRPDLDASIRAAFSATANAIVALYYTDWEQGVEEQKQAQQASQKQTGGVRSTVKANERSGTSQQQPRSSAPRRPAT